MAGNRNSSSAAPRARGRAPPDLGFRQADQTELRQAVVRVALDGDQRHIEVGETAGEDDGERHVGYYWSRTAMPRTASLLRRECPNLARLVRHTLNLGSLLEGPLTDRIPDSGNPGCQGQVATISAVRRSCRGSSLTGHSSRHYLRDRYTCFHGFAARARCTITPTVFSLSPTWRPINR